MNLSQASQDAAARASEFGSLGSPDLLCFSHLRWDFVYQRPQHLLSRCAKDRRVFFIEEPVVDDDGPPRFDIDIRECGVRVAVPRIPAELDGDGIERCQRTLLDALIREHEIEDHVDWYYTPMALGFSRHLEPIATIYDCMDELSGFLDAPPALREREAELFERASLVFTGGHSLYRAKRDRHPAVFAFPSSIDAGHFRQARDPQPDPEQQAGLGRPRLGYFGVIDERIDLELLAAVADLRPDWALVMVGPVVKIRPESLPQRPNIHYLGRKPYAELPAYISGWDVAIMPFARNAATRFISPTKTPEYLAGGRPVVSTSIRDVVSPYAERGLVTIADTPTEFVAGVEAELARADRRGWRSQVDEFLGGNSWDSTWAQMATLIDGVCRPERACSIT